MNAEYVNGADAGYRQAEQRAARYFAALHEQVREKSYVATLTADFQLWRQQHIRYLPWQTRLALSRDKAASGSDHHYIQWMDRAGKLDDYLDRSISYIYMRDLGKAMNTAETRSDIERSVTDLKRFLMEHGSSDQEGYPAYLSFAALYRWGQREGVEAAVLWVVDKLEKVAVHIPQQLNAEQAQRKLIKIIVGVVMHVREELDETVSAAERSRRLDEAIRLGYSYGLTYPFIDDLLDSSVLTDEEKGRYSRMIRTALLTRAVPKLGEWAGKNKSVFQYIHAELREAFEYVKNQQRPDMAEVFFEQAYVFFHAQEIDRAKDLSNPSYTNEQLYIPIILKSASSRLICRTVTSAPEDEGFNERTFYYGIYNQLADDFTDMFDDEREGAVTPYTYYLKYRNTRNDLINPFELYWTVIAHLIHHVYDSDDRTREIILDRAINGLKRCKKRVGKKKYRWIMEVFASGNPAFSRLIQRLVRKADDVDFFDKRLRDQVITMLKTERKEKESFFEIIQTVRQQINTNLLIHKPDDLPSIQTPLIDAANYSMEGNGKRLRPILTWVMGVQEYGLDASAIMPLLRSLEYMHTASLIFDDLPTQDNAATRRGNPTLHQKYDSATAELTGLLLMQRAVQEQALLDQFEAKRVLALIHYAARAAEELCNGQAMDLASKGRSLSLEELTTLCHYKTGIAFEAALVMPAILAGIPDSEIARLKTFAYHTGIAFQIKDDLLDVEGDLDALGKPTGQDAKNNNTTFVSVWGQDAARQRMWEHYCLAMEALQELPRQPVFLKHLLHYIVSRNK